MPPARDWPCLVEALLRLAWARFMIRFLPFPLWRRRLGPLGARPGSAPVSASDKALAIRVGRSVRAIAARVPFHASCLPQALAARWMLEARGMRTELYIGARAAGELDRAAASVDLHAWLMVGELCLTGAASRAEFRALGR